MSFDALCEIEEEERSTVRQKRAKECGYTGLSILHRLNALYGFEYDRHMVYDELHGISLNAVKNHIAFLKADEDDPIDWKGVDGQLHRIPWLQTEDRMLIGVNILSSLRLGQRYAAHEQLLCTREHGRVFGRLLELYVLNVVFFRSCPHRSTWCQK